MIKTLLILGLLLQAAVAAAVEQHSQMFLVWMVMLAKVGVDLVVLCQLLVVVALVGVVLLMALVVVVAAVVLVAVMEEIMDMM